MASDDGDPGPWGNNSGPAGNRGSVPGSDRGRPGRTSPTSVWPPSGAAPTRPTLAPEALLRHLFGGGSGSGGPGGGPRFPGSAWLSGGRGLALMALVLAGLWVLSGIYRVEPDQEGVVQRFGRFVRLTPPGLNYHFPWPVESVQLPSVTHINRVEIGYRSANSEQDNDSADADAGAARQVPQESLMLTGDENIIDIDFAVFWRVSDAEKYVFATRDPDSTIKEVAESVMREVIGRTPIQPALTNARAQIEADVLAKSQAILDHYGAGVELSQVQLQKVDPPSEVIDSFRDVQRANTEAERTVNDAQSYANNIVPRARGDAAAITAAGEGAKAAAIAQATGDAKRFESVLAAYQISKDITLRRIYIETMQDLLAHAPAVVVDSQMKNLVPLLQLGTPHATVTETTPAIVGSQP